MIKGLKLKSGAYEPDMGITFDDKDPYIRMYKPVYDREYKVDEHYAFVDDSFSFRFGNFWAWYLVLKGAIHMQLRVRWGMRVHGRDVLKKYKNELAGGYISIANHMHRHDCEAVLNALNSVRTIKIPMFQKNFETKDQFWLKVVGGIPIPPAEEGLSAMKQFNSAFDEFHRRGYSFHIFPEMSKWTWYPALRPFQKGAFTMAYKYQMPIVPVTISFRERTGIYKLFAPANEPLIDVTIGEPLMPDTTQPRKQEVDRLLIQSHTQMLKQMGIEENPWSAIPE